MREETSNIVRVKIVTANVRDAALPTTPAQFLRTQYKRQERNSFYEKNL